MFKLIRVTNGIDEKEKVVARFYDIGDALLTLNMYCSLPGFDGCRHYVEENPNLIIHGVNKFQADLNLRIEGGH